MNTNSPYTETPNLMIMEAHHDLSIFLLGDNEFSLYLLEKQLNNRGYAKVSVFSNTNECIAGIEQAPDVIFVDAGINSSGISDQLGQIKRINPNVYLVVIADREDEQLNKKLNEYGVFECLIREWDEVSSIENVLFKISGIKSFLKNASFYI